MPEQNKSSTLITDKFDRKEGVLRLQQQPVIHLKAIGNLAADFYYIYSDEKIDDVVNELSYNTGINAIGVINHDDQIIGLIIRKDLFNIIGKPYCRDVLKNRSVEMVTIKTESFHFEENIFNVADKLEEELHSGEFRYFLLKDDENHFLGIFNTKNLMVYLSEKTRNDLEHARRIQRSIIKDQDFIKNENFELAAVTIMAHEVGGDIYFVKKYSKSNWVIFICDVCGKGISASLVSSVLGGMAEIYNFDGGFPVFLDVLNEYIGRLNEFVTGIFIDYNENTGEFVAADMGHGFVYLFNGTLSRINPGRRNPPIGVMPKIEPYLFKGRLLKGESLVLLTDGVIEQIDSHQTEYPLSRLERIMVNTRTKNLDKTRDEIISDIKVFREGQPQNDDITFVLVKNTG